MPAGMATLKALAISLMLTFMPAQQRTTCRPARAGALLVAPIDQFHEQVIAVPSDAEHAADGVHGFEGRFAEVSPPDRIVQTFEWDGMPGHVMLDDLTLEDLGDGRTRAVIISTGVTPLPCSAKGLASACRTLLATTPASGACCWRNARSPQSFFSLGRTARLTGGRLWETSPLT